MLGNFCKKAVCILIICLFALSIVGCSNSQTPSKENSSQEVKPAEEQKKEWPKGLTWSGSAMGGAHYMFGAALAKVIGNEMGLQVAVEGTGGPWQNMELVNTGDSDLGPVPGAMLYEGYTGTGNAKQAYPELRVILPMFPQYLHWWTFDQKMNSFRDIEGKRVDMSGAASFANDYGRKLFDHFNVKPSQIVNISNFDDVNQMMNDGQLDAGCAWSGIPAPPAQEMATTRGAKIIGVPKEDAEDFIKKFPVSQGVIPAKTYEGQVEDISTLAVWTFTITNKDLPDDLVYEIVKTAFENNPDLVNSYKASIDCKAENIVFSPIPVHKGAVKYYKEIGIELPDNLLPPEMK